MGWQVKLAESRPLRSGNGVQRYRSRSLSRFKHRTTMATPFLDEETSQKVTRQVEFYFSDSNLLRDGSFTKTINKSEDGLVSLDLICSFPRMRSHLGLGGGHVSDETVKAVAETLRPSGFLKLSQDGKRIGRSSELAKPEEVIEQIDSRTIAASPFESDTKREDVESFFSKFGKVIGVRLPHHIYQKRVFCGSALIEFSTEEDAGNILKQSLTYSGAELELRPKKDFDAEREKKTVEHENSPGSTINGNYAPEPSFSEGLLVEVQDGVNAALGSHITASLYVTGLDGSVAEACLHDLFVEFGKVLSVKICRDRNTGASRGCGYVNYNSLRDATEARKAMDFKVISGRPIRVMFSNRNITCGGFTVFFKNFAASIDIKAIEKVFSRFGTIIASELVKDCKGRSKGFGFIKFDQAEAAEKAIDSVNGAVVRNRLVYASPFICKEERDHKRKDLKHFPTLYVRNFHELISDEEVRSVFSKYGRVVEVNIIREPEIFSVRKPLNLGFGFVVFECFDEAVSAIKGLNGKLPSEIEGLDPICVNDRSWYVGWAKRMFKRNFLQKSSSCVKEGQEIFKKLEGTDLYIKNLDDNISEKSLERLFSEFGMITSKVMIDSQGRSRGCAFVAFATPEDATKAMNAMNGKIVVRKPLNISVAKRKERKADLQAHFAQPQEVLPYLYEYEPTEDLMKLILEFNRGDPIACLVADSLNDFLGRYYYCRVCGCIFDRVEPTLEHLTTYHPFITEAMVC